MVKINEHIIKINIIKEHIKNSKGQQRRQFIKRLHRLQKELSICEYYLKGKKEEKPAKKKTAKKAKK